MITVVHSTRMTILTLPMTSRLTNLFPRRSGVLRVYAHRFLATFDDGENQNVMPNLDDGLPKDYKLREVKCGSRRLDTVLNRSIKQSSSQVEKLILSGKVRVNEEEIRKKAYNVEPRDVIEVWNEPYVENSQLALTDRLEILDYTVTPNGYHISIRAWKKFLTDNWKASS
ncbi:hypothetical protein AB6A40_001865 [Gnathostoma spinigerum]|uniref:RNA-binding S4 domain-containing protein n=1 Tax=Gnathostoma spinigerum TaxID=75299 RepID=A0ABD6E6G1_9BILA